MKTRGILEVPELITYPDEITKEAKLLFKNKHSNIKTKPREEIIKKHALMLLWLYGVKEKLVKKEPQALNTFVELLLEELEK